MPNLKLASSLFTSLFALAALTVAGCGGSSTANPDAGGDAHPDSGTGGRGGSGGVAGGTGGGTGGVAGHVGTGGVGTGGAAGSGTGGAAGRGGAGGAAGAATGGAGGGGTAGAGGASICPLVPACVINGVTCLSGVPQRCLADANGCPRYVAQAACSTNQTCNAVTGTCVCNNDVRCGGTPAVGQFCPTSGVGTFAQCNMGADGCFTVSTGIACTSPMTCNTAPTTLVAPPGTACGCSPVIVNPTDSTRLINTGCTAGQATAATRIGSAGDDLILVCQMVGTCPLWQLSTNCSLQGLTAGSFNGLPACVCKDAARWAADFGAATTAQQAALQKPNQYYVDPDPPMVNFMNGPTTGSIQPAACRYRSLTQALQQTNRTEVVTFHEAFSNVHLLTATADAEVFPMQIPAGVRVYTADVGSFNPAHYTLDVNTVSSGTTAIELGSGSSIEGYTIDASGTTAANAGTNVVTILQTPASGATTGLLNQDNVSGKAGQTAVLIQGQSDLTLNQVLIVGPTTGVQVNRTDPNGGTAALTATTLTFTTAAANGRGVSVGPASGSSATLTGPTLTLSGTGSTAIELLGGAVTATGASLTASGASSNGVSQAAGALTLTGPTIAANGTGILVLSGTAAVTGGTLSANTLGFGLAAGSATVGSTTINLTPADAGDTGYRVTGGTLSVTGGSVTGGSVTGFGVDTNAGETTLTSVHLSGGTGWTGVRVASTSASVAGNVTLTGTTAAKTIIDNIVANPVVHPAVGLLVGDGTESVLATTLAQVTIADNTTIQGNVDGVVVRNGHVVATGGGVAISGNTDDGVQVLSSVNIPGTNPANLLSQVGLTATTISNNGRLGVLVRNIAPVSLSGVVISSNGPVSGTVGGGIEVQRSPATVQTAFLFNLLNSQITNNRGCGVALTGGTSLIGGTGIQVCGVGSGALGGATTASLRSNTITGSVGVGLYISESPDSTDGIGDVTQVDVQDNVISGNLTVTPFPEPLAGGVYVAASDPDNGTAATVNDVGCSLALGDPCTRVQLVNFVGNVVSCNGRSEIGFAVPQRTDSVNPPSAWDIGSASGRVDMSMACSANAHPNTVSAYGQSAVGLFVSTPLIHVTAVGVHWASSPAVSGTDYSTALGMASPGNNDGSSFIACTAVTSVCP